MGLTKLDLQTRNDSLSLGKHVSVGRSREWVFLNRVCDTRNWLTEAGEGVTSSPIDLIRQAVSGLKAVLFSSCEVGRW